MWAHAALLAARNIPIFMIVAAPPVAAAVDDVAGAPAVGCSVAGWLRSAARKFNRVAAETSRDRRAAPLARGQRGGRLAGGGAVVRARIRPSGSARNSIRNRSRRRPSRRCARDPAARIFTYDQWGDYLIYRLYPRTKVFVDGRSDFYGADFESKVSDVLSVKYDWEKTLDGFGVDTILLPPRAAGGRAEGIQPLAGGLRRRRRAGIPVRGESRGREISGRRWRRNRP